MIHTLKRLTYPSSIEVSAQVTGPGNEHLVHLHRVENVATLQQIRAVAQRDHRLVLVTHLPLLERRGMGHTLRQTFECFSNARFKACMCFKLAAYHELGGLSHALSRFLPFVYYPKRGLSYEHKVDKFTSSKHNLKQI